jgi:hypothetical protein
MPVERVAQLGDNRDVIAEGLERLQDRRELEVLPHRLGRPEAGPFTKRHEHGAEPALRIGRGFGRCRQSRHHRFEQRQGKRDAQAAQEGPPGQRQLCDEHDHELL